MEKIMDTPRNCRECKYNKDCYSYYGGSLCKHTEAINREAIYKNKGGGRK